jgi:tRNA G18 (ribose-2'-O)-methylase SpoU
MIRVEDPADPRIEHYRAIRDRDLAGRAGRFVAEGEVVVRALLGAGSRFRAESLLLSEARADALGPALSSVGPAVPVYVAGQQVMDAIVGFHIHRGVLAIGLREEEANPAEVLRSLPEQALVLGLSGLSNHDNVGGAFRNAAAFGADLVLLDRSSCDPLYRKAIRVSVGASLLVRFTWAETVQSMTEILATAGFSTFALSPTGSTPLERCRWPRRTALLVGSEGRGLPAALLEDVPSLGIAMAPGFDSLNVATAAGIALHAVRSAWTQSSPD